MNESSAIAAVAAAWLIARVTRDYLNYRKATRKPKGES